MLETFEGEGAWPHGGSGVGGDGHERGEVAVEVGVEAVGFGEEEGFGGEREVAGDVAD